MTKVYYNEFDPFAAAWLKELMKAGEIPDGEIDTRSIIEVKADDIKGFTQCHFFAGIGGWAEALRLANWPADRPVWTGSCPCQPFSTAGKQKGKKDERHLWPVWFSLIRQCNPTTIFGEQVAASITHGWLDSVYDDMEAEGYACGAAVLPACSVSAPHRRERLWFVGNSKHDGHLAATFAGSQKSPIQHNKEGQNSASEFKGASTPFDVAESFQSRLEGLAGHDSAEKRFERSLGHDSPFDPETFEWIECPDGKIRPVKSGVCLLADGISSSLERMRECYNEAVKEVIIYGKTSDSNPTEVLSMVRKVLFTKKNRQGQAARVCSELYEKEILFNFLFCIESASYAAINGGSIEKTDEEIFREGMRMLYLSRESSGASYKWQSNGQYKGKSTDSLYVLSFFLARTSESYQVACENANASYNRVGKLRGYGNSINPQTASEFIKAAA